MKYELRAMEGQGSGSIVNIASTYGHKTAAGAGRPPLRKEVIDLQPTDTLLPVVEVHATPLPHN
jgi:hypothetical protein